ncbi:MAG TPA: hypothetical protein VFV38_24835, partial [Ktedonobacteraceae bacterium]|nr:hypothetical protein [Ktedonobacteraceae bacterium]
QIIKLDGQVNAVIDTILLIARAVMAVLYSRIIHSLRKDDEPEPPTEEEIDELVAEKVNEAVQGALITLRQEIVSQLDATLSQRLDERLTALDAKQAGAMAHLKEEQATMITETVTSMVETALRKRANVSPIPVSSPKVRSITDAASRKRATGNGGEREIDKVVWPLLNTGMSVRAIAAQAKTSTATVGRSRQRWEKANKHVSSEMNDETEKQAL